LLNTNTEAMKTSLKDLGITIEELYNGTKQILINLSDKQYQFHVVLLGRDNQPDCKISSWGANLWARTNKGMNYEKYETLSTLQSALVKLIKTKVDTNGEITFDVTDDIHTM
jgi:hypothetical protein